MKARHLRVSYHQPETCRTEPPFRPLLPMPFLRLQGRWLDRAGFAIGAGVHVQVTPGRLVLEVIEAERTVECDVQRTREFTAD